MTLDDRSRPLVEAIGAALVLAGCAAYEAREAHERRLTIAPDPVPCADGTPGSCLRVTDAEGNSWITHLDEIEGFTYEPGFTYELLVEEASEVAQIEAATPPRLRLIQVVSKEASGEAPTALNADLGRTRWRLDRVAPSGHAAADWAAKRDHRPVRRLGRASDRVRRVQQLLGGADGRGRPDDGGAAGGDPQGLPLAHGHGARAGVLATARGDDRV